MCDKVVSKKPKMLQYCAVDTCLSALKSVADSLITIKMFEILDIVFSNDDIDLDYRPYINSDIVTFFSDDTDINAIDLHNINLDNDPEMMIHIKTVARCNEYK